MAHKMDAIIAVFRVGNRRFRQRMAAVRGGGRYGSCCGERCGEQVHWKTGGATLRQLSTRTRHSRLYGANDRSRRDLSSPTVAISSIVRNNPYSESLKIQGYRSYAHRMFGRTVAYPRQQRLAQILCNLGPIWRGSRLLQAALLTIA
jgi:hypothetical protein